MTFATESAPTIFSKPLIASDPNAVATTVALFQQLSIDDQLAVLWYVYTEIGRSVTPAAPGAARLQLAEGLLNEIKELPQSQQLQVMRDLAGRVNSPISRAYGVLSANTKLAFWYQLAVWMSEGAVIPMPIGYEASASAKQVLSAIQQLEFSQQITVLRNVAAGMGIDPLA